MTFKLPALPYAQDALEPHITAHTLSFHYGKHHQAYVTNLNKLIADTPLADKSLEEIILETANKADKAGIFNNAAQVWNHTFYWNSMSPNGGGKPTGPLGAKINESFGSFESFVEKFKTAAATQFGSGWAFLVQKKDGSLDILKTGNADTAIVHDLKPLLTIDVWEHAYYLDYQNRRPDYISTYIEKLINWDFVTRNLG